MADYSISQLTEQTTASDNDLVEITINASTSPASKKMKRSTLLTGTATQAALDAHTADINNPHAVTKAQVGLGSVDNTADSAKPISTAIQTALNGKANSVHTHTSSDVTDFNTATDARITAQKGSANGLATLDSGSKVPSAQLPSYVDDVLEFTNQAAFPGTGSTGVIYVALDTNKTYRWSGSGYVEISPSPGSTDAVPEGSTNKYYTDTRVSANTDVAANTTARHTHSNKALLDTYTQTEANLADAVSKKHASTLVGTKTIDETNIANGRVPAYNGTSGKLEYVDQTGGTGGGATNLTTTQAPTSVTINSDTGTDATVPAADTTNAGVMAASDKTKLNGIATGATANDTDANLKNRANHTGTQTLSTISDAGTAASKNVPATGNAATGEVVIGTDTRLSDARTPTAHTHAESDVTGLTTDLAGKVPTTRTVAGHALSADVSIAGADLTMADVTTNNVSTTQHGFAPKAPNDATKYLDGTGAWSVPAGGGGGGGGAIPNMYQFQLSVNADGLGGSVSGGGGNSYLQGARQIYANAGNRNGGMIYGGKGASFTETPGIPAFTKPYFRMKFLGIGGMVGSYSNAQFYWRFFASGTTASNYNNNTSAGNNVGLHIVMPTSGNGVIYSVTSDGTAATETTMTGITPRNTYMDIQVRLDSNNDWEFSQAGSIINVHTTNKPTMSQGMVYGGYHVQEFVGANGGIGIESLYMGEQ